MLQFNTDTPVLFLIFNRPEITRKTFEAIQNARPKRLYVAADGPRNETEKSKCELTRSIATSVDWDCSLLTNFRESNLGCRKAVSSAIDWFFEQEPEGIILEDDCLPSASFFSFCSQLLEKYRQDERIAHIGGVNFQNGIKRGEGDYYFSKLTHVWGWAGWRRVWQQYDPGISSFPEFESGNLLDNIPSHFPFKQYWLNSFRNVHQGVTDTWDYQYAYLNLVSNRLSIIPNVNLVSNIGTGADATHTLQSHPFQQLPLEELKSLEHPQFMIPDLNADIYSQEIEYGIKKKKRFFWAKSQ